MIPRLTALVAIAGLSAGLWAQTPSPAPSTEASDRLGALRAESDRLTAEARTLLAELQKLEHERDLHLQRVDDAQAAIVEGQTAIEATAQRLLALEAERLAQIPAIEAQLVDLYKRGRTGYAQLLLTAGGIREFGRATRATAAMLTVSQARIAEHRETVQALERERATLEMELDARRMREADARRAQAAASRAVAEHGRLLAKIDAQRDSNAKLAGELQLEIERAQPPPAATPPEATAATAPPPSLVPLAPLRGALLWPVSGRVVGRFGRTIAAPGDPSTANGIEIASRAGNPVRALHSGTISFTGAFGAFGNLVILDHGGNTHSLYGYLGAITVSRNQEVQGGTELGRVGERPSGDAILYLEIRIDGRSVDPLQWLRPL